MVTFIADKQTLEDLNISGKYNKNSIFSVFNNTRTRGGEQLLENMFQNPLSDAQEINQRAGIFRYFQQKEIVFPFEKSLLDIVEGYISRTCPNNRLLALLHIYRQKCLYSIARDKELEITLVGCQGAIDFLGKLKDFLVQIPDFPDISRYVATLDMITCMLENEKLDIFQEKVIDEKFSLARLSQYDYIFRCVCSEHIKQMIHLVYLLDVYIAVGKVAREKQFSVAHALPKLLKGNNISIENLFHPQLFQPIPNSIRIDSEKNVIFLTGANMSGKSTLIKSLGIAVYLAHMGFPVAAQKMEFTLQDGIYTSINMPDNLSEGYSHFYAEVMRIKKIAQEVSPSKNFLILFDELFKGTNVKDAYDATVALMEAFASIHNCSYLISSHISESGNALKERCTSIKFHYFPTTMENNIPRYSYQLQTGISNDCYGMMIIRNEHILDILNDTTE